MKILFIGASIVDANRDRSDPHHLGYGFAMHSATLIKEKYNNIDFEFFNLGIGGNRTEDLAARIETDCIAYSPDIVIIQIGLNDTWHYVGKGEKLDTEVFEQNYRHVLSEIKSKTSAKIVMLEQFCLPTPDKLPLRADLIEKIEVTRRLAREYANEYIPLDGILAAAIVKTPPTSLAEDGAHPNERGSKLIAGHVLNAVSSIIDSM